MRQKETRIYEISFQREGELTIVGDLHIEGDLKSGLEDLTLLEITGDLFVNGKVELEGCDISAKSVTILGGCWARGIETTVGDITIQGGNEIDLIYLNSAANIKIGALEEPAEVVNKVGTASGCADINYEIKADGDVDVYNIYCSRIIAGGDVTIEYSACICDEPSGEIISVIEGKNVYGGKVIANKIVAEDSICLEKMPEPYSTQKTEMLAKEIIIMN